MIPFIKGPNVPGNGAAQEVNKRQNEPHSCNTFLLAKLTLIKGKFLLAASEEHLNAPSVRIEGKNLLCREFCTGRDKYAECFSFPKGIFRIAQQHDSIIMAIDLSLIPVYIVVPFANCHEADIGIILADTKSKIFGLLSDLVGIDDAIGAQCANRFKSLLIKGVHQFVRCVPAIAQEICRVWRSGQFVDDALDNLNLRVCLVIQYNRIIQRKAVAG